MIDKDSKIKEFHTLKPANYGFLRMWQLDRSPVPEDQDGTSLHLQFVSGKPESSILRIDFKAVIQMRINSLDKRDGYIFDIKPVQDQQWEDGNYHVTEAKYDAFSFVCKDFSARYVSRDTKYCSFCGKSRHEVPKMIAGPNVFICSECLDLSNKILSVEVSQEQPKE